MGLPINSSGFETAAVVRGLNRHFNLWSMFQSRLLINYHGGACSERQTTKLKSQFLESEYNAYAILKKYVFKCFLKVKIETCCMYFR